MIVEVIAYRAQCDRCDETMEIGSRDVLSTGAVGVEGAERFAREAGWLRVRLGFEGARLAPQARGVRLPARWLCPDCRGDPSRGCAS